MLQAKAKCRMPCHHDGGNQSAGHFRSATGKLICNLPTYYDSTVLVQLCRHSTSGTLFLMQTRLASSWNACILRKQALARSLSSTTKKCNESQANKAFAETLLLPKTQFPLRPDFKANETAYGYLTRGALYRWQVA